MHKAFTDLYARLPTGDVTKDSTGTDEPNNNERANARFFCVQKADEERHLVFGWASIAALPDGSVVEDYQHDMIAIGDLEEAAYNYVMFYREGGEMHERGGVATLVESIVFTADKMRALGIQEGVLPYGWWIGMKVTDEDVWQRVKDGSYLMFSIGGQATREAIQEE